MNKKSSLLLILIISLFLFFYRSNVMPKNLAFDELEFARLSLSLRHQSYLVYTQLATGHSTLYFYILLLSFKIFGITKFALRFPAQFFALLSSFVFYFLMEIIFKNKYLDFFNKKIPFSFLSTLSFITLRWFFNFSRFAFEGTFLIFLELSATYFFFKYIHTKKNMPLFFSAILSGLAFNSYTPGRIFFFIPLFFLLKEFIFKEKKGIKKIFIFIIPLIILITPLATYLSSHQDNRINQLFFLKNSELSPKKKIIFLGQNVKNITLMFNFKGDVNGRHNYPNKPALNSFMGGVFLFGLFFAFKNPKKEENQFFLLYFFLSLLPSILTYPWENPNMLRTVTVIPSLIYFSFLSVEFLSKKIKYRYFSLFLILLFFLSSFYDIRTYFKYQSKVFPNAFQVRELLPKALKNIKYYEENN